MRNRAKDRKVVHFIVQADAYNRVIQMLGTLPYAQVAGTLQALTEGSQAVFEKLPGDMPPPSGKIVDKPPVPDDDADEQPDDQPPADETVEMDETPANVHELHVDPPANDSEVETKPEESA